MTAPTTDLLTTQDVEAGLRKAIDIPTPYEAAAFRKGARWAERALLARLGEQRPVAWRSKAANGHWMYGPTWGEDECRAMEFEEPRFPKYDHDKLYAAPIPTPAPVGAQDRKAAEHAYITTAFAYASAPVGSRDWTLFWGGWQAARSAAQGTALKTLPEQPDMGDGWSVTVCRRGVAELTISDEHYSGGRDLDEALIVGAAQHLLAFVGYGLPPCSFDPDEAAHGAVQVPAWRPISEAPTDTLVLAKHPKVLAAHSCTKRVSWVWPGELRELNSVGGPLYKAWMEIHHPDAAAPAHAGERSEGGA